MKTRSAKAKGRRLSAKVRELILEILKEFDFGISDDDITVTPAGVNGPDVVFSPRALEYFPFDIECKNQERLNIWGAIKQVEDRNKPGKSPLIIFSKNRSKIWVTLDLSVFLNIWKSVLRNEEV